MAAKARPIPEGFHSITPHLTVRDAVKMIEFYKKAFGAKEIEVKKMPDGKVMHAKIKIGDTFVMLNDEFPDMGGSCASLSPLALKGVSCTLNLYVEDADFVWKQAIAAGATEAMPMADMFWGDRYGLLTDPSGHRWAITTHKEDLTPEQIDKRAMEFFSKNPIKGKS